jgi:GMP synthase (glutamine-hydrolysing)
LKTINRVVVCLSEPNRELNRVPCDTTKERLHILREVDAIVTSYCTSETAIWQAPVVQLPLQNERGEWAFVIRPVRSVDGMTADFFPLSPEPLAAMLTDLKKIPGVGPLFYDVTSKPPATIEWE